VQHIDAAPAHHVVFVLLQLLDLAARGVVAALHLLDAPIYGAERVRLLPEPGRVGQRDRERDLAQRREHDGRGARRVILE